MGLLINERKVRAAAGSMHQFCQQVRAIFPGQVDDRIVEAATVYLYLNLARDLFGHRFASRLLKKLARQLKYCTTPEIEATITKIVKLAGALEKASENNGSNSSPEAIVRAHVVSVIEAMLTDAGFRGEDPELSAKAYEPFERAVMAIRKHLMGIKEQNNFLMRMKPEG